jgi:cytochrome d ubiquinol oxidase subunit II
MSLPDFWFWTLGALLAGYAVLDGFDLGAGIVYLGLRSEEDRRAVLSAVGPYWDGNEVWLIAFGGALFAAFPDGYATAFSAFYMPFILLLFALIFRAVSLEFRGKRPGRGWRSSWDAAFSASSALAALLFGVAVGNALQGLPIGPDKEFTGSIRDLLEPYPLLVGALSVSLLAMHGCLYLDLKTSGELQAKFHRWSRRAFGVFLALVSATTVFTFEKLPWALRNFHRFPAAWAVVAAAALATANIPRAIRRRRAPEAFVSSSVAIAALVFLFGFGLYPNVVLSSLDPAWSLTTASAASSEKTLRIMRLIACLGMPFVLLYTAVVYRVFRGKVDAKPTIY